MMAPSMQKSLGMQSMSLRGIWTLPYKVQRHVDAWNWLTQFADTKEATTPSRNAGFKLKIKLPSQSARNLASSIPRNGQSEPEAGTRKRAREDDSESDPASEDTVTPKKHSHPSKHSRITQARMSPAGSDEDINEEHVMPVAAPKKCGRPFKVAASEEIHASFSVPVYVEIAVPPKLKPRKTYKGNKMEKQAPRMEEPFTLTRNMSWGAFLTAISNAVDEDIENLSIGEMKWGIQRKGRYPLVNRVGYMAMHTQIAAQKEPSSLIIMIYLPMPRVPKRRGQRQDDDDMEPASEQDNTRWGQKVGTSLHNFLLTASYSRTAVVTVVA